MPESDIGILLQTAFTKAKPTKDYSLIPIAWEVLCCRLSEDSDGWTPGVLLDAFRTFHLAAVFERG